MLLLFFTGSWSPHKKIPSYYLILHLKSIISFLQQIKHLFDQDIHVQLVTGKYLLCLCIIIIYMIFYLPGSSFCLMP